MKTEENKSKKLDIFPKEEIYTGKFVNYINSLSDNLKEYYKVSLNIIKNRTYITNSLENELNESIKANSFNISNNFKDLFYKLKFNNKAENDNLTNFYEDAKILFQEMKEYQKLVRCRIKKQGSLPGLIHNNSNKNSNLQKPYQQSDLNFIIDNNQKGFKIRKNDYTPIKRDLSNNNRNKYNIVPKERGEPYNFATINYTIDNSNDKSEEIEKYKKIIKNYKLELKKINIKYQNLININNNNNEIIKDELILNKDNIISSLKEDLSKSNKKISQLVDEKNILQTKIKQMIESKEPIRNNNNNIYNKFNNLIKENDKLKSELNSYINLKKQNNLFKNKISFLEKKLNEEQTKNEKIKNENIILLKNEQNKQNKQESELSKRNTELSLSLINKQNEIINLQKENLDKSKEIENLKISINNRDNNEKEKLLESIRSIFDQENSNSKNMDNFNKNVNTILDNYKKQNYQLIIIKKKFEEKVKYLQEQLTNTKIELIDKIKTNMELENKNTKQIKDLKNEYNKKIEQIENKKINVTNEFNSLKELYDDLMKEKKELNDEIVGKELKLIQIQNENEQYKKEINKLNNMHISNILLEGKNEENIKNEYIELNKKLKQEKDINNKLNSDLSKIKNENEKYKNKLLTLGIIYIGGVIEGEEVKIPRDDIIEKLNDEIEKLKQKNATLNGIVESFTSQFSNNKVLVNNDKDNQKIEEIKQKYYQCEEEIKSLKKEKEKLTNQIIRLSTNLPPEEFNKLKKQYKDLENKYKELLKNETKNSNSNNINNNINNININNINNNNEELIKVINELKKENEQIKKKNLQLISQLEEKEIKANCYDNKSENAYLSNYEEEFDLKKMAKGAKEKNRSQDINIDYPGIQNIKEKYRELYFYYNSLENLVKKLLTTIQVNSKNKTYVSEICKIVGFDLETTNKILNNKNKNLLLGLFPK